MLINIDENDLHFVLKGLYKQDSQRTDDIAQKILSQVNVNSSHQKSTQNYIEQQSDSSMDDILKSEEETLKLLDDMINKKNQIMKNSKLII
jgi:hypothetical protein